MRLTHQGISELRGKNGKRKYISTSIHPSISEDVLVRKHIILCVTLLFCYVWRLLRIKSTFLRPSKSDYRQHLVPSDESRWRCGCTAPGTEKDNVIRDLTKANYRLVSDHYKYVEYFYKNNDTILTSKKSQQYKELKIFRWLCSKKNQSQLKKISLHYAIFTIQNYRVFDNFERRTEVQESDCLKI